MVTRNFMNLIAVVFGGVYSAPQGSFESGYLPVISVQGNVRYLGYPIGSSIYSPDKTLTLNPENTGISLGTGTTAATENDIQLENTITEGLSLTLSTVYASSDEYGNPITTFNITVTNISANQITISEVGYKQNLRAFVYPQLSANLQTVCCLLDRTVLDTPLTLRPSDAGVIHYSLKTNYFEAKTVSGVKCVSFTNGSDEDVAACIDAAHQGTIDLQTDCGWRVGDARVIDIGSWINGEGTYIDAGKACIVISQFGDYMNCGCLLQFDFLTNVGSSYMHNSDSNQYQYSLMVRTTLPELIDVLPTWLKTRLMTFSVLVGRGSGSSVIDTITNQKLSLRSEVEITGGHSHSASGEGAQIEFYEKFLAGKTNQYPGGYDGYGNPSYVTYWLRSPDIENSTNYLLGYGRGGNEISNRRANYAQSLAPFGCL